ncbi:MAG: efflux RND transporter periplasmic adaptor subunit [Spirosomataceae bacterium]
MKAKYLLVSLLALAACSKPESTGIDAKKAELVELKSQQADLTSKIKTLESEIAKLDPNAKKENTKVKSVTVDTLTSETFKHFIEVQGTVDAKNNVMVSPRSSGAIVVLNVKEGDVVKAGAVIAKIDDSILKESIEEVKNQWSLANTVYEKQKNLWSQQIGTELQYLQAKNNKESLEKRLKTLETQVALTNITSPISGVVDKVNAKLGDMAMPGMGIARVVNLSQLKVIASVADSYLGTVRKGDAVTIKFPDLNKEISGRINFVSATVNPLKRTFDVEIPIPNVEGLVKPNQLATVLVNDKSTASAIVIEQNIVQSTDEGDLVYVAVTEGSKKVAKARKVKLGMSYNGNIEIVSGLQAGDLLITQGYQELTDGQEISF